MGFRLSFSYRTDDTFSGATLLFFQAQRMALSWVEMLILATRNMADFEGCGIRLIDPWKQI